MKKLAILLTGLAALSGFTQAGAGHVTRTQTYIGGPIGDATGYCAPETPLEMNVGAVCFSAQGGARHRVSFIDTVQGSNVGYQWSFNDADGNCVGTTGDPLEDCANVGFACGTQTLAAPPGAVELAILLDGVAFGVLDCIAGGPGTGGMATTGSISATSVH